jgi:hypothetical protein
MIIASTEITENGLTFNQLTHADPYYFCVHNGTVRISMTEEGPPASGKTSTLNDIFGADTYENLITEMERLEIPVPNPVVE